MDHGGVIVYLAAMFVGKADTRIPSTDHAARWALNDDLQYWCRNRSCVAGPMVYEKGVILAVTARFASRGDAMAFELEWKGKQ